MAEDLHPEDYQECVIVPTNQTDMCCPEGLRAHRLTNEAFKHRNDSGSQVTDKLIRHLLRREDSAMLCHRVGDIGKCALEDAGVRDEPLVQ
jgi:hypothetical protein